MLSERALRLKALGAFVGNGVLLFVTSLSALAVLFIFFFIARDAFPFFRMQGLREFFTSSHWYPTAPVPEFGALAIFWGSGLVTLGAAVVTIPLGVAAAVCLSDVLPFSVRQAVKPAIEMLAVIPSVAYGFFALVVFAPLLQEKGGHILSVAVWIVALPVCGLAILVLCELIGDKLPDHVQVWTQWALPAVLGSGVFVLLIAATRRLDALSISSGTNALNVSIILGIMALPTVVSVSEDALQAVGRDLREGSYALGATRAETILRTVIPAAGSGIAAAVILGVMRAVGETMVVWMASGNSAHIPEPWYNFLEPIRTLTATVAGDMGEADHVTGSARYHVLWAMALCLLIFTFVCNLVSEHFIRKARKKMGV
jgi:phosphate transport system permease protein